MNKRVILFIVYFVGSQYFVYAQVSDLNANLESLSSSRPTEFDVTTSLLFDRSYADYLSDFTNYKSRSTIIRDYSIGVKEYFYVRNILDQDKWYEVKATLVDTISNYAIWMESIVYQDFVQSNIQIDFSAGLRRYLLEESDQFSVDPSLGLIEIINKYVGDFPDSDKDGVVDILFLDIIDRFETTGQFVAGFFDPVNLSQHEFSNQRDMVYMDIYPTLIENDSLNLKRSLSTLVHELQHLIHAGYEGAELENVFINEGFSEAVEIICGFPPRDPTPYLNNPIKPLLSWDYSNPISDYSRASLWTHYLVEQFGITILNDLIQNEKTGLLGYDDSIKRLGGPGFEDTFKNWGVANAVNNLNLSDKYSYQHPLLMNLKMTNSGISSQIPNVISGSLPSLSHSLISIPYVKNVHFQSSLAHDNDVSLTGILSYPNRSLELVKRLSDENEESISDIEKFGSVSVLFSNNKLTNDSTSGRINILVDGEHSAIERLIGYGDGINDSFYSNASYLKLSNMNQRIGIIFPNQDSHYWLKKIILSAVFDSELVGNSNLANTERDFIISIYEFKNSKINTPLIEGVILETKREPGKLIKEEFSLEAYFESLSSIEDSIVVVIENDPDDENFISIGLDFSESLNGIVYDDQWIELSDVIIGGNSLAGYTPNIKIDIIENSHQVLTDNLIQSIEYNFEKVIVEVTVPFGYEEPNVNLITKLPDDSFLKLSPVTSEGELYSFELPVQVDGNYSIKSVLSSSNPSVTITDEIEWMIDLPSGIKVNQNYPNPFNPTTSIPFTLIEQASIGWNVYDILGRNLLQIEPKIIQSGEHIFELDLTSYASGVYFVRAVIERERTGLNLSQPIKVLMIK